ncbi:stAR-related lipid transfer protein 3-like [Dendronephthya gigantea]|uniref:stAR-related lipid transfer protein 3-like n=1 Tax=Dendronephthya gigantea TaxID=151771 RepID=UPI0010694A24|nr:stAR-related lipid transfer protein 3-like [Dendronephthya gigantea]
MAKKGKTVEFQASSSSTTQLSVAESAQALEAAVSSKPPWFRRLYNNLSSSRQIFCLFCIFDFLFTFLLWVIYAQGVAVTGINDSLSQEVKHYGITSSLFDIMILSLVRVTLLLWIYGYLVCKKVHVVALTTFVSTVYLLTKAFVFDFDDSSKDNGSRPVDYFLEIGSFVLVWVEAWYMRVKVLPKEKKAATSIISQKPGYGSIKPPLSSAYSVLSFHTPPEQDSEDEEEVIRENLGFIETARKATSKALGFLYAEKSWDIEKQKDGILVESTTDENLGKILRLRACINANHQLVHPMVFGDKENIKKWNKNITHAEIIQKVNSTTDITYSCIGEMAGGIMSARDYVTVNHYQRIGEMYMSTSTSVISSIKPPIESFVRGETILNSYALLPAENETDKSEFVWIVTTVMKPPNSVPQMFIDRGVVGFLIECTNNLRNECELLKSNANNTSLK